MPDTKSFSARIKILNDCFTSSSKRYWSKRELLDRIYDRTGIEISERTLLNDIYAMRYDNQLNYDAPIKHSKQNNGYHYEDRNYSIDKLPLTEKDIQALEFAAATLSQYKSFTILNEFTGAVDKVVNLVNQLKYNKHQPNLNFIDFEKAPYSKGAEHLDLLVDTIKNKNAVQIFYQKFEEDQSKPHVICPYLLKEYRNRWYLLGHAKKENKVKTFGLDRITKIISLPTERFISPNDFTANSYFKNTIGVTYHTKPIVAILSFSPFQGNYVKTQHLHETQEIIADTKKELRIKIKVVPNYELVSTILSYGSDVRVISPVSLRNKIKTIVSDTLKQYNS